MTTPEGLVIRGWGDRLLAWVDIDGFELAPHRRGRRDQICARVDGELVPFPHPDAKSLALRPQLAQRWYLSLIERIDAPAAVSPLKAGDAPGGRRPGPGPARSWRRC